MRDAASRRRLTFLVLIVLLPMAMAVALGVGSVRLPIAGVVRSLLAGAGIGRTNAPALDVAGETILWTIRLPRVMLAALIGGGLAVVGAVLQSVFRNPIADAGLLGVSTGAAFGAVMAIHLGLTATIFLALPMAAFAGSVAAIAAVYLLAHLARRASVEGLLLTGIAVSALTSAGTAALLVTTEEYHVKAVLFWLAGGLDGRSWAHLGLAAGAILPGAVLLLLLSRPLDVLSLGDDEAASLGLHVHLARLTTLGLAALITGAATAVAGSVPFVGLVSPHALRPLVGPLARHLLPAAFLGGALVVVVADLAARTANANFDLPLGSVTAVAGAPYFLLALRGVEDRA
jgi:iron complex transport system permease protein